MGVNSRLDTLQAAILLPKLQLLDEEVQLRNQVADNYSRLLNEARITTTPFVNECNLSSWAQYTIRVNSREEVQARLKEAGVPTAVHYPTPLNKQPAVADYSRRFEVGDEISCSVLSLPIYPYLSKDRQGRIIEALLSCLNKG